jgi:hypothetical protein
VSVCAKSKKKPCAACAKAAKAKFSSPIWDNQINTLTKRKAPFPGLFF